MKEENNELITVLKVNPQWLLNLRAIQNISAEFKLIDLRVIKSISAEFKSESRDTHDEWRVLQSEDLGDED